MKEIDSGIEIQFFREQIEMEVSRSIGWLPNKNTPTNHNNPH